jgi:hypothetical protein
MFVLLVAGGSCFAFLILLVAAIHFSLAFLAGVSVESEESKSILTTYSILTHTHLTR